MDFYYGLNSGNSSRAAFCLYETGGDFSPRVLDTQTAENRGAAYLTVNPMGKIPSIQEGDFRLWESNAINLYLAEKYPAARLIPESPQGRASVHRWLFFQAAHVTPACVPIFRATNKRIQEFWKTTGDLGQAAASRKELARYLAVLDGQLERRTWLERDFSLADIAYAPHLALVAEGGFDFGPWPSVRSWLDRLLARPAWKQAWQLVFEPPTPATRR